MNEWFKKTFGTIKEKWGKWTVVQKGIVAGIVVAVIVAIVVLFSVSKRPTTVRLFNSPVTDETQREAIITRLDQDNIKSYVSTDGYISVESEAIARKYRSRLVAEGYEPSKTDPWALFDTTKWSRTSFDDKVNWKRAMETAVKQHLEQLEGIRSANVILDLPEDSLFAQTQKPTQASVILFANPGSDILEDKTRIKGIQHLIMRGVEGLQEENITITNGDTGVQINDFEGMEEYDRLSAIEKQEKMIRKFESEYSSSALKSLQSAFGKDRVRIANMTIEMDMSKRSSTSTKYSGINIKEDNPDTPYDDGIVVEKIVRSEETVSKSFTGTGYNPEGPEGTAGQNPPVYSDASNLIGKQEEEGVKRNYALNETNSVEEVSPQKGRRTISVNIDGSWSYPLYDKDTHAVILSESGGYERKYTPLTEEDLLKAEKLVKDAIGYDARRGDSVTVTNIQIDRTEQFREEDAKYIKAQQTRKTVIMVLIGVAAVLLFFIIFRFVTRELERRRRLREEELLRKQQAEREQALWEAKEQGMEVTMSVEERKRAELQENAIAMAKEHPEDVAMLIRTWLMEE